MVLVQLAGGNDGLNTLVPFEDADYYRLRPTLGIAKDKVLGLTSQAGLHPSCTAMNQLYQSGKLAIVQNVGYPNPNRSHFRSTEIWETASGSDECRHRLGRSLPRQRLCRRARRLARSGGGSRFNGVPQSFMSAQTHTTFGLAPGAGRRREDEEARKLLESMVSSSGPKPTADGGNSTFLKQTLMDTLVTERKVQKRVIGDYRPTAPYPGSPLATSLRNVAALVAARMPTRVYFVTLGGFDTHSNQVGQHGVLLTQPGGGNISEKDLEAKKLDSQVITMTFSEIRTPAEWRIKVVAPITAPPLRCS